MNARQIVAGIYYDWIKLAVPETGSPTGFLPWAQSLAIRYSEKYTDSLKFCH
jgi:hypothetical protein